MAPERLEQGLIQVYTGDGKGKTPVPWGWPCGPRGRVSESLSSSS